MAARAGRRFVSVNRTIWGVELRVVLTAREARDLEFIEEFGPDTETQRALLAELIGQMIRSVAWSVAGGVEVHAPTIANGVEHGALDRS